jgi:hypothetical protein
MALQGTNQMASLAATIDGLLVPRGYADGVAVEIEPNAPVYEVEVGSDGEQHRRTTEDRTGLVTFRVKNTSNEARRFFDAIFRRHELGDTRPSLITVTMISTGESATLVGCSPADRPTRSFGGEISDREYAFHYAEGIFT